MSKHQQNKGFLFTKKNKVSVWVSTYPYKDIPDSYFEESFTKSNTRAHNQWSNNFKIRYFKAEDMETNGCHEGAISIKKAAGECSFSQSYITALLSKAKKKKLLEITWIVLLFEYEYSAKISAIEKDQYMTLLGAFNYDDDAESVYEVEDPESKSMESNEL